MSVARRLLAIATATSLAAALQSPVAADPPAAADPSVCETSQQLPIRCPKWIAAGGDESTRFDDARMAIAPDGSRLYVAGIGAAYPASRSEVVAQSPDGGSTLWVRTLPAAVVRDMAAGADGARLFVASTVTEGSRTTAVLQALDVATGRSLWTMTAEGVWGALRETLAVSPDARVVYAARMVAAAEDGSAIIVDARDAASGTVIWSARHDGGYGQGVAIAPDGSAVYVAGAWSNGYLQVVVAYRASDGARLWLSQWVNTDAPFQPRSITVSPDGGLLALTGENSDAFDEEFVTTRVLDARSGVRLWDDRDFVPGAAVTFGCDGSTVFSTGATGSGYWTFAYEAVTGRKRWEAFALNTPAGTYFAPVAAEAIATSADCTRVYVAGRLGGLSDIRAYDAPTGRELWTGRADGTADRPCFCGGADDLSVAPDGTVYAAGGNGRLLTMSYDR